MNEPQTPEEVRAREMAEMRAEIEREMEWESYDEYTILMIQELMEYGGYSGEEMLAALEGKPIYHPHWL